MTESFTAELHHYIAFRNLDLVHFTKGQRSKDEVARVGRGGGGGGGHIPGWIPQWPTYR